MPIKEIITRVEESKSFKAFKHSHPRAYFCAGFFVFDFENTENKQQLDYYISEEDGIETFAVLSNGEIVPTKTETVKKEKLEEIEISDIKVELEEAVEIAKKEMEKSKLLPTKLIVVLQKFRKEGENKSRIIWNITGLVGFSIFRLNIDMHKKILLEKSSSMLDMMRIEKREDKEKPDYTG